MIYEKASTLLEAELGDEVLGLDPEGGACFGFNPVAASVWRLLDTPRSADQINTALLAEYEVEPAQCATDVDELLQSLVRHGLVRATAAPQATSPVSPC